eukprot:GDKH01015407.1.p3 GENE.GDKH01015407.1~~GDKH01015407.1.p3  ORF type:complete len:79 (+),score=5.79 GDKH01015407.1:1-237(+)
MGRSGRAASASLGPMHVVESERPATEPGGLLRRLRMQRPSPCSRRSPCVLGIRLSLHGQSVGRIGRSTVGVHVRGTTS